MSTNDLIQIGYVKCRTLRSGYTEFDENTVEWTHTLEGLPEGAEIYVKVPKGTQAEKIEHLVFE